MPPVTFDDPLVREAMRAFLEACAAVDAATDDAHVLALADAKAVAGMQLRKRLLDLGWTAPAGQRSTM